MEKLRHMEKQHGKIQYYIIIFVLILHTYYCLDTGILPKRYIIWRQHKKYNPFLDIRKNLPKNNTINVFDTYFSYYKIKYVNYNSKCNVIELPSYGDIICVECQNFYSKNDICNKNEKLFTNSNFYHILNSYCHGTWIKITETDFGECPTTPSFITIKQNE